MALGIHNAAIYSYICYNHMLILIFLFINQALAGEVGMSNELDDVARALFNGHIPSIWRRLAPATLKTLGNWMLHFQKRYQQYHYWVRMYALIT